MELSRKGIYTKCDLLLSSPGFARILDNLHLILLSLAGLVCFFVNAIIDNAVIFHDEFVYKIWSTRAISGNLIIANGVASFIPNSLYTFVYGIASYAGSNFYLVAQFFNVVFWLLGIALLYDFSKLFNLNGTRRLVYLLLIILLPLSAYTKYFMPEAMYFFVFILSVVLLFRGVFFESQLLIFCAGVVVGFLYYVKPHAIVIFVVTLLVFARIFSWKEYRRKIFYYVVGFGLIYVIGKLVVAKPGLGSALGVYDQMLSSLISSFDVLMSNPLRLFKIISKLLLVHVASFALAFGAAYFVLLSYSRPSHASQSESSTTQERAVQFGTWLSWITASLIIISVVFSVLAGESERVHTRYYSFLFSLWLIFFVLPLADSKKFISMGNAVKILVFCAVYIYFVLVVPGYSSILHLSLVSDSPELGFVFAPRAVFLTALIVLASGSAIFVIFNSRSLLIVGLCIVFITSQIYVRGMQKTTFRGPFTDGIDAVSVERQLGRDIFSRALVIGESRDQVSKFLFGVNSAPLVVEAAPGDVSVLLDRYSSFDTVLFLSPGYVIPHNYRCGTLVGTVSRCVR